MLAVGGNRGGAGVRDAVGRAHDWLHRAIQAADGLAVGGGNGPVHHFHALRPRRAGAAA